MKIYLVLLFMSGVLCENEAYKSEESANKKVIEWVRQYFEKNVENIDEAITFVEENREGSKYDIEYKELKVQP